MKLGVDLYNIIKDAHNIYTLHHTVKKYLKKMKYPLCHLRYHLLDFFVNV